jgi:reversibly glycosylated polypeptide
MLRKRAAIVCTTIFEPLFLDGYLANLERHGRRDSVELFVIIDRKTPATVGEACADAKRRGFRVHCPTLPEQEEYLARFPSMRDRVPYDSDNRRNIGFLMALESGAEILISIDDDNFCLDDSDFVGEHAIAGESVTVEEIETDDGWLNIGTALSTDKPIEIYARGFPYFARNRRRAATRLAPRTSRVAVNAGLWTTDPDVDALTRIAIAPRVHAASGDPMFLGPGSWSPINTQNTAVVRDAVAAYYYVRMGFSLGGLSIDRYGDILSGYFVSKCAHERGDAIRVGSPIADHRRTPHNLFKDLYNELACVVMLDDLLPWLMEVRLRGSSYAELYEDLAARIEERSTAYKGFIWDQGGGAFLRETAGHMRAWLDAVRMIG